jgi:hypothetical protein
MLKILSSPPVDPHREIKPSSQADSDQTAANGFAERMA